MNTSDAPQPELRDIRLTDYLFVILRWRKAIFWTLSVSICSAAILLYLVVPRYYRSTAVIMPPKQKAQFSMSSLMKNIVPFSGFGLGRASDELYNYIAIVRSRSCMELIVRKHGLVQRYGVKTTDEALKELDENLRVDLSRDDMVLEISVDDTEADTAARMANAFVETLNSVYLSLMTQEARSNREFIGQRYRQNLDDLKNAEESMRDFQKKYGVYSLPDQLKAAVQSAAEMKSRLTAKELELGILERMVSSDDSRVQQVQMEISELNRMLRKLKFGAGTPDGALEMFAPFDRAPELGMEYVRRYREIEVQQKMMELIFPIFEQAKLEEHRDTPTILILDHAVAADKPVRPRRLLMLAIVAVSALLLGVFLTFVIEYVQRIRGEIIQGKDHTLVYIESQLHLKRFFFRGNKDDQPGG